MVANSLKKYDYFAIPICINPAPFNVSTTSSGANRNEPCGLLRQFQHEYIKPHSFQQAPEMLCITSSLVTDDVKQCDRCGDKKPLINQSFFFFFWLDVTLAVIHLRNSFFEPRAPNINISHKETAGTAALLKRWMDRDILREDPNQRVRSYCGRELCIG